MVIVEDKLREKSSEYLHFIEAFLYVVVGALFAALAVAGVIQAVAVLWQSALGKAAADYSLQVLDQLLLILMLVELLHTVRLSVRSQTLMMEPFLIVGLIASIRRVLVITMQAAKMTDQAQSQAGDAGAAVFRNTMVELGGLGFLCVVSGFASYLLRRSYPSKKRVG